VAAFAPTECRTRCKSAEAAHAAQARTDATGRLAADARRSERRQCWFFHSVTEVEIMSHEIQKALALVDDLETKRAQHVAKAASLSAERDEIALGAFTGVDRHRKRLDELHAALARHGSELAAMDAAIKSARERLAEAEHAEALADDRAHAAEARKLVAELDQAFAYLDKTMATTAKTLTAIDHVVNELHKLGFAFPSDAQIKLGVTQAICTWEHHLPKHWHAELTGGFRFLAPGERRGFADYWRAVEVPLNNQIRARLSEPHKKDVAA
jgi:hypothetical protein